MEKILGQEKVKEGYKQTSIGIIPDDWEVKKLGQIGVFQTSSIDKTIKFNEDLVFLLNYMNVYKHETINNKSAQNFPVVSAKQSQIQSCNLKKGDILFTPSSETPNDIGHSSAVFEDLQNTVFSYHLIRFRPRITLDILYSHYFCNNQSVLCQFTKYATGSTRFTISIKTFSNIIIPIPPLPEQQKIASILSIWDEAISKQKSLVEQTKKRNQGLAQQLLTGKKRLKGFDGEWKFSILSKVVNRVKNSFIPEQNEFYQQIGIRSHTKGLFYKEPVSGKELGKKSVFWIEPNCFVVNIVFAWEHAIAKTTANEIGMIASHRFPMFKPKKDLLDLDYLLNYFKSPKGKDLLGLASPGGAGRNKTLGQAEFLKLPILLPYTDEQKAISKVIEQANIELQKLEQQLILLQNQKKGLMQKLLTGEVRVNIN